jgi:hypothetical protein
MTQPSIRYQLIEVRLGEPFAEFVAARYPRRSWRQISDEIEDRTGLTLSKETLRQWFADRLEVRSFVRDDTPANTGSAA